jgi:hypothetical protein
VEVVLLAVKIDNIKTLNEKQIMGYYWNDDTIEYFKKQNKPGCEGEYIREIWDFVKNNCTLEDGETYEMLGNDLITKTKV